MECGKPVDGGGCLNAGTDCAECLGCCRRSLNASRLTSYNSPVQSDRVHIAGQSCVFCCSYVPVGCISYNSIDDQVRSQPTKRKSLDKQQIFVAISIASWWFAYANILHRDAYNSPKFNLTEMSSIHFSIDWCVWKFILCIFWFFTDFWKRPKLL